MTLSIRKLSRVVAIRKQDNRITLAVQDTRESQSQNATDDSNRAIGFVIPRRLASTN